MLDMGDRETIVRFLFKNKDRVDDSSFSIVTRGDDFVCEVYPVSKSDLEDTKPVRFTVRANGIFKELDLPAILIDRFLLKAVDETCQDLIWEIERISKIDSVIFNLKSWEDYDLD